MKVVKILSHALVLVLALSMLSACGKKPPECADAAASDSLRQFMNTSIAKALPAKGVNPVEDAKGLIAKYLAGWDFKLSNVTTKGYDEKSKTRSCAGKVTISIPNTQQNGYTDVEYDMQTLEDGKSGEFQLSASKNFQVWAYGAMEPVANYYKVHSVFGTWSGHSSCDPSSVEKNLFASLPTAEAEQGFTVLSTEGTWVPDEVAKDNPLKITIADGVVTAQITGPGGKEVARTGKLNPNGSFEMGTDDELKTAVLGYGFLKSGVIRETMPNSATAKARVKSNATGNEMDATLVRRCGMELQKQ